ncbi:TerB family tellurite resistance protein [Pseudoalteromonas sp. BDTF-M6]|uniref:tellurite resistance TerB family protein n=1 Tax=Pseudoalteromonas sp. BDTF-M6 TaxID=2796132 RepID=UPI001BAF38AC|nr:TerB family tellurite resistance protein [Pseudoalteromonas sp. BDTF-M6]MBS3799313.1 TerB family tellurite resistance protein [Pseudoalteromonas sp. BDTF-M6]
MLEHIKQFFTSLAATSEQPQLPNFNISVAALLIEVMRADSELQAQEQEVLQALLQKYFALDQAQVSTLIQAATQDLDEAIDYFRFSKQINEHTSADQRVEIVQLLWQLAYADGELDKHEEHVVRRVADLLYVSHGDFIKAKLAAQSASQSAS